MDSMNSLVCLAFVAVDSLSDNTSEESFSMDNTSYYTMEESLQRGGDIDAIDGVVYLMVDTFECALVGVLVAEK
jgi:hypothetical protein